MTALTPAVPNPAQTQEKWKTPLLARDNINLDVDMSRSFVQKFSEATPRNLLKLHIPIGCVLVICLTC